MDNKSALYAAFKAKDARFDGRFFVGISSTGIYCRPVCRARQPKMENCAFFHTAAEAEQAGYRPGLCTLGTRVPGCFHPFEMAVRAVLGQQISVSAAGTLAARIARTHGAAIQTGVEGLTHVFPSPEEILALGGEIANHFGALGVTAARSDAILELARASVRGEIDFDLPARPEAEIKKLMKIRGIGSWTAHYIAMRAMEWPDAFLETDAGVKRALQPHAPKELRKMSEAWRPWRSYATVSLWNTL